LKKCKKTKIADKFSGLVPFGPKKKIYRQFFVFYGLVGVFCVWKNSGLVPTVLKRILHETQLLLRSLLQFSKGKISGFLTSSVKRNFLTATLVLCVRK